MRKKILIENSKETDHVPDLAQREVLNCTLKELWLAENRDH